MTKQNSAKNFFERARATGSETNMDSINGEQVLKMGTSETKDAWLSSGLDATALVGWLYLAARSRLSASITFSQLACKNWIGSNADLTTLLY
jgi:hypothetical protein